MPIRRRFTSKRGMVRRPITRRRTTFRKRRTPIRRRSGFIKTIMPPVLTTKMRYMDYFNMATGGASAYYTVPFRMNGAYDPVFAAGGGSCTGWNQIAAIYGKYRVLASKIEVWAYNTCTSPVIVSIFARSSTGSVPTSAVEVQQKSFEYNNDVRAKQLIPYGSGTSYPRCYLSMYKSIKRLENNRSNMDEDYSAATSTTPVLQTFWDVNLCTLDGASINSTANYTIRITYYVRFTDVTVSYTD